MRISKLLRSRLLWISTICIIYIVFFLINFLTPVLADDYNTMLHLVYSTDRTISSASDLFESINNAYTMWTGRIVSHVLSIACSYLPYYVFDACNALVYMIVTWLMYKICIGSHNQNYILYMGIHCLLWIFVPDYGQVMFWMCGSVCYLWMSALVLLVIWIYRKNALEQGRFLDKKWYVPIAFLLGLLAGNAMENMSAGMLVVMTLYFVYFYKHHVRINESMIALYVGSLVGFALLFFSYGNGMRYDTSAKLGILFKTGIFIYYFVFFIGGLFVLWFLLQLVLDAKQKTWDSEAYVQSVIMGIAAVLSVVCLIAAPSLPERAWYIGCVFAILMVGILFSELHIEESSSLYKGILLLLAGALVFCGVSVGDTVLTSYDINSQLKEREAYILHEIEKGNMDIVAPAITYTYPFRSHHDAMEGLYDIQEDTEHWVNKVTAKYYGIHSIAAE